MAVRRKVDEFVEVGGAGSCWALQATVHKEFGF
jgi:hypothetical protein